MIDVPVAVINLHILPPEIIFLDNAKIISIIVHINFYHKSIKVVYYVKHEVL